jgi:hypothetical protein
MARSIKEIAEQTAHCARILHEMGRLESTRPAVAAEDLDVVAQAMRDFARDLTRHGRRLRAVADESAALIAVS